MPAMITIAKRVREQWPQARFVIPAANEAIVQTIDGLLGTDRADFHLSCGIIHQAIEASDFCVVASGTATLEVAAHGKPMVVMYHVNPVLWKLVGWWLVPQRPMCLVNILAGRVVVPEFMPWYGSAEPVIEKVLELLADSQGLAQTSRRLLEITQPLKQGNSADAAAQMLLQLADKH
jgi:lipid-A-disaccharide synthase